MCADQSDNHLDDHEFLNRLQEEKLAVLERRENLISKKMRWIPIIIAIGFAKVLKIPIPGTPTLTFDFAIIAFYIAPWIALAYDVAILGEDYGVKRMATFVRNNFNKLGDGRWETWIPLRRDTLWKESPKLMNYFALLGSIAGPPLSYLTIFINDSKITINTSIITMEILFGIFSAIFAAYCMELIYSINDIRMENLKQDYARQEPSSIEPTPLPELKMPRESKDNTKRNYKPYFWYAKAFVKIIHHFKRGADQDQK